MTIQNFNVCEPYRTLLQLLKPVFIARCHNILNLEVT